jgi:tetratricopeptide (TPR) repeat protein
MKETRARLWAARTALCAVALAAYANSFGLGLALDAKRLVAEDTRVHAATATNFNLILGTHYWYPHSQDRLYRPLTTLSFLANYVWLGSRANPAGYHVVNFLLHAANVLLLFALARRLLPELWAAWFAAALWAVHPVTTESVTNIAGRADLLSAGFVLGALLVYASERTSGRRLTLAALCLAGCLSKESAAVLPGLMLLWDLTAQRKPRAGDYAAVVLALAAAFWLRERAFAVQPWPELPFLDNPLRGMGFWTAWLTAIKVLGMELLLLVWPANLGFDHSYNQIGPAGWRDPWVWVALAAIVEVAILVFLRRKRDPVPFFAAGFCGITLLPTANLLLLIGSIMAVRFLYLPAAGFAILISALVFRMPSRRAACVLLAAAVALLAARTLARNPAWDSDLTLASADAPMVPRSFRAHAVLASGLVLQGRAGNLDPAIEEAEASWSIVEALPAEWNSEQPAEELSVLCQRKGDQLGGPGTPAGRVWYEKALGLAERAAGIADVHRRLFDEAQLAHGRALPILAGYEDVYANLGILYYALGRDSEALAAYRKALAEAPERRDTYDDIALVYARANNAEAGARTAIERVLSLGVTEPALAAMTAAFQGLPDGACAVSRQGNTAAVNFDCPAVKRNLCPAAAEVQAFLRAGRRLENARQAAAVAASKGCAPLP